ncbi:dolichyl-diphosphooligosaccharide--protein glycosyltransferase subunit STT3B-like [Stylophora pistillata]|uniref:dolichyl-diphosphooligosaccharide--protein glycosyltransferase subunit STT3B-like n=1 Tax=Stylophora pistillata TaxID=50429 RepID=UPI000C040869|nr:dolichyl-diphosphooligosaccharide--protein glycosyltransferase subunit STT3B-like [Stylophora pistillata]
MEVERSSEASGSKEGKITSAEAKTQTIGWQSLLTFTILSLAWLVGFASRLFAVIRFESIIHEFDPWFNYRSTHHLVTHGFYNFLNWFDERAWYPLGRIVGGTVYPGLMLTSASVHWVLNTLNITVHIRDVCVFLAPMFSGLTAIATYLLTKELWNDRAGLFAACFIAIDCLVSAWGGYVFIINLIPLHVFFLLLMGRFSFRIYVVFFVPGTFALLQAYAFLVYIRSKVSWTDFKNIFVFAVAAVAGLVFIAVIFLTYAGYVAPWRGRFYSLYDTGYAKIHIPIIASVSEHQPTTWVSFFFDLHVLICTFPAGLWFVIKNINDERVFVCLYATTAVYFAGVMVRLMLTLTPVVCILAAIAFSVTLDNYLVDDRPPENKDAEARPAGGESSSEENDKKKKKDLYDKVNSLFYCTDYFDAAVLDAFPRKRTSVRILDAGAGRGSTASYLRSMGYTNIDALTVSKERLDRAEASGLYRNLLYTALKAESTLCATGAFDAMICADGVFPDEVDPDAMDEMLRLVKPVGNCFFLQIVDEKYLEQVCLVVSVDEVRLLNATKSVDQQTLIVPGEVNRQFLLYDINVPLGKKGDQKVGKAMSSNETSAYKIMKMLDVDYVLVIFGGVIGYSGDDINKFLWMVRIAEGEHPQEIKESDYFTPQGEFRVDSAGSPVLLNCLMYKMCYYRFGEMQLDFRSPSGFDRTRNVEIGNKNFHLEHLEEAFTSEHWLVRIYKVKDYANRVKSKVPLRTSNLKPKTKYIPRRNNRKGHIKDKVNVIQGKRVQRKGKKKNKAKKVKKST